MPFVISREPRTFSARLACRTARAMRRAFSGDNPGLRVKWLRCTIIARTPQIWHRNAGYARDVLGKYSTIVL
jgi:hypothetical protein